MFKMRLVRFKVEKFKSVMDSGWIDCEDVTTLVGVNEAGKSNLLLALWKLNPAKGGGINLADDMPVKFYSDMRLETPKHRFITAEFEIIDDAILKSIAEQCGYDDTDKLKTVHVARDYDEKSYVSFPDAIIPSQLSSENVLTELTNFQQVLSVLGDEAGTTTAWITTQTTALEGALEIVRSVDTLSNEHLLNIKRLLIDGSKNPPTALIQYVSDVSTYLDVLLKCDVNNNKDIAKLVKSNIPKFVYYSNYGNLDSEIYLPHVIENLKRTDLPASLEAKVRTLKVLFEYVKLDPAEILELGIDAQTATDTEIAQRGEKKKQRDILLQSASAKLTREFREWWKQGDYIFDLSADGKHFRIWVADNTRPEKIVLENRSTGLQWFLSFYLVFLVESQDAHADAIILLDEAGLSLHPLAQKDLSAFFSNLANTNQILNTTHSPFLVDTNNIDKAKVVYVDTQGYTVASNNLRANQDRSNVNSIYAIHSALGLSVSDILIQGCKPVIVEGPSDQYYFNAIKLFLISKNKISPKEELIFIPSGGVKAVSSIASLISAKTEMPYIILDSDKNGEDYCSKLKKELYREVGDRIITAKSITSIECSEIEDMIPYELLSRAIDRLFNTDLDFGDHYQEGHPLIPQIESFARENGIELPQGYKVDLARFFKQQLLKSATFANTKYIDMWTAVFKQIC